jgi:hypothetical protein
VAFYYYFTGFLGTASKPHFALSENRWASLCMRRRLRFPTIDTSLGYRTGLSTGSRKFSDIREGQHMVCPWIPLQGCSCPWTLYRLEEGCEDWLTFLLSPACISSWIRRNSGTGLSVGMDGVFWLVIPLEL